MLLPAKSLCIIVHTLDFIGKEVIFSLRRTYIIFGIGTIAFHRDFASRFDVDEKYILRKFRLRNRFESKTVALPPKMMASKA